MRKLGPGRYLAHAGEEITVRAEEHGTAFAVGYSLNAFKDRMIDNTPLTFRAVQNPTILVLAAGFSGPAGGRYDVTIGGAPDEDRDTDRLEQVGSSKIDIHEYEFTIT